MDYIKFNCYDLASQNTELYGVYNTLQSLHYELSNVLDSLDPQITGNEAIRKQLSSSKQALEDIVTKVNTAYNSLDQIIDIYYETERQVLKITDELPTGQAVSSSGTSEGLPVGIFDSPPSIGDHVSAINSSNLILEGWLAELIFKK